MNGQNLISHEDAAALGKRLAAGDRSAAPPALNLLEQRGADAQERADSLLAEISPARLGHESPGVIVGITGPPGAGKSTLLSELIALWRKRDKSVAVLAIDPSSKRSGGSLLGDRARMAVDSRHDAVLVRSSATATRLGGLAPTTRESAMALAATFDVVIVETVGVGQSETDIAELAVSNGLGGDDADDPVPARAMIGGAPYLMAPLETALRVIGIEPVYAFSTRASVEQTMPDGSVRKVNDFRHAGFVPAIDKGEFHG